MQKLTPQKSNYVVTLTLQQRSTAGIVLASVVLEGLSSASYNVKVLIV